MWNMQIEDISLFMCIMNMLNLFELLTSTTYEK